MYEEDVLSLCVGIFMILVVIAGVWGITVSNMQANDCIKRGGEVISSGECVKKGTKLP